MGSSFRCSTWVGSSFTLKHKARLERLASDKHSRLLQKLVNYGRKKFLILGHVSIIFCRRPGQGILTEREGSVQLTSTLRFCNKIKKFDLKSTDLNKLVQGGKLY